jgi:hypothetical protein
MAPRVQRTTRTHPVQDGTDTVPEPELAATGSSIRCRRHHLHHGTNSIYTHNSSSSLFLADDEDSSAGSPDEADGKLCQPHYLHNNAQL